MKIAIMALLFVSMNVNAFHAVTEILPSGEMLICKDFGQVKKNNIVESHVRVLPMSQHNKRTVKKDEFTLPAVGKKIGLYHRDFHLKRKTLNEFHEVKIGSATIVETKSIVGLTRIKKVISPLKSRLMTEEKIEITNDEALTIDQNCIVAIADKGLVVDELAAVTW